MSRLKALREASELLEEEKNLFIRLSRPVDRERLNPDFVMLFGLTPHEVERLVAAMEVAKQKLSELEARHAMIEKEEDGSITVTIPIFPTDGGLVYDEWQQTMRSTLGEQRWSFYTEISRNDVEPSTAFGMFGLQRTEMHVKPNGSPIAQANWSPGSAGGSHKVVNSNPRMLRKLYPLIHQKLVTGGFLPPEP